EVGTLRERMTVLATVHQDAVNKAAEQRRAAAMAVTELARLQEAAATLRERVTGLERERAELQQLGDRLHTLERERDLAADDARHAAGELSALRTRLHQWSGTVERALAELARAAGALGMEGKG